MQRQCKQAFPEVEGCQNVGAIAPQQQMTCLTQRLNVHLPAALHKRPRCLRARGKVQVHIGGKHIVAGVTLWDRPALTGSICLQDFKIKPLSLTCLQ